MIAKRINHKGNCTHPQTPAARRACRKALLAADQKGTPMPTLSADDLRAIAAKSIARARDAYGQGAAGFDRMIAGQGVGGVYGEFGNATYGIVREMWPVLTTDQAAERFVAVWEQLSGERAAYEARCKARRYAGTSQWSRGPIQYAN